jgi:hypothetical protein
MPTSGSPDSMATANHRPSGDMTFMSTQIDIDIHSGGASAGKGRQVPRGFGVSATARSMAAAC